MDSSLIVILIIIFCLIILGGWFMKGCVGLKEDEKSIGEVLSDIADEIDEDVLKEMY